MAIRDIHLRTLLKLLYLPENRQISALRSDIRSTIARESGEEAGGGDFDVPFWRDARGHACNGHDLTDAVRARVAKNSGRARLYPALKDGFLKWWNEKRRWTNEPFHESISPHGEFLLDDLGKIKIRNVLAVRDAAGVDHFVYPYFSEYPVLSVEAAQIGLWVLTQALPSVNARELRILDVLRGEPFSFDRFPLTGREQEVLKKRYRQLVTKWDQLRSEYE